MAKRVRQQTGLPNEEGDTQQLFNFNPETQNIETLPAFSPAVPSNMPLQTVTGTSKKRRRKTLAETTARNERRKLESEPYAPHSCFEICTKPTQHDKIESTGPSAEESDSDCESEVSGDIDLLTKDVILNDLDIAPLDSLMSNSEVHPVPQTLDDILADLTCP